MTTEKTPRVYPLWVWFLVLLTLAVMLIVGLAFGLAHLRNEKNRLQSNNAALEQRMAEAELKNKEAVFERTQVQQKNELERKTSLEQTKLTLAVNHQKDLITSARTATNRLGKLMATVSKVEFSMGELKTNVVGRSISLHPDLVIQARRMYESAEQNLVSEDQVTQKLEDVRLIQQQLQTDLGTAAEPAPEIATSLNETLVWTESQQRSATQLESMLVNLARQSKAKVSAAVTGETPLLQDAILMLTASEANAYDAIINKKKEEGKVILVTTQAEIEKEKLVAEAEAKRAEADRQAAKRRHYEEDQQALVQKQVMRQRASSPEVQSSLVAFTTPGMWMPSTSGSKAADRFSIEAKPMSLNKIRSMGALSPTLPGLRALVEIGNSRYNDRPRLGGLFSRNPWYINPQAIEDARRIQQLLIEFGPALVEMGQLSP